jgi:hypothetical protein
MFGHEAHSAALVRNPDFIAVERLIDEIEELPPKLRDGDVHDPIVA